MRVHAVTIAVQRSDQLYCSDGFEIGYVNDEKVRMTFSPACCDREAIAFAANTAGISGELMRVVMVQTRLERFGEGPQLPHAAAMAQRLWLRLQRTRKRAPLRAPSE